MREAIKAKEAEYRTVKELSFKDWCEQESITLPEYPANPKYPSFEDILGELDIKERNRYYTLGADTIVLKPDTEGYVSTKGKWYRGTLLVKNSRST